jgi:hypothetical protein
MTYAQHPLSAAFPSMPAEDRQSLTDDIEVNGQREPIVVFEGMVIDGWHRYQACLSLGLPVDEMPLPDGEDPVAYVKSRNLHRRHLTGSQRAAAVVACSEWHPAHRPNNCAPGAHLATAKQMAREADVGVRTIVQAKAAQAAGLGDAVREGKVSAKRAAEVAKLPAEERAAAIAAPAPKSKTEAQQMADDAHGDFDPLAELEAAQIEIERLQGELQAAEAEDLKAEAIRWKRSHQVAERRQGEIMDAANNAQKHSLFLKRQLDRCGKAVGENDPDKIAPAVEAFVRKHTKVPA